MGHPPRQRALNNTKLSPSGRSSQESLSKALQICQVTATRARRGRGLIFEERREQSLPHATVFAIGVRDSALRVPTPSKIRHSTIPKFCWQIILEVCRYIIMFFYFLDRSHPHQLYG
jgi:hypothetical protein